LQITSSSNLLDNKKPLFGELTPLSWTV